MLYNFSCQNFASILKIGYVEELIESNASNGEYIEFNAVAEVAFYMIGNIDKYIHKYDRYSKRTPSLTLTNEIERWNFIFC